MLTAVNVTAFVLLVIAFARELRARTRQTEDGRALLVVLAAMVTLAGLGLLRRADATFIDDAALAAWVAVTAAAAWVITRTRA